MIRMAMVLTVLSAMAMGCKNQSEQFCRQAVRESNQIVAGLQQRLGGGTGGNVMPEEPFVSRCRQLAPAVAHCAVPSYGMAHPAECEAHRAAIRALR